jgi:hypothetical protein
LNFWKLFDKPEKEKDLFGHGPNLAHMPQHNGHVTRQTSQARGGHEECTGQGGGSGGSPEWWSDDKAAFSVQAMLFINSESLVAVGGDL